MLESYIQTSIMKKTLHFFSIFIFIIVFKNSVNACGPIVAPDLTSQSIVGTNLVLNWSSVNPYQQPCNYFVEVEVVCNNSSFTGS